MALSTNSLIPVARIAPGIMRLGWTHLAGLDALQEATSAALEREPRVELWLDPDDHLAHRMAHRVGYHREGLLRGVTVDGEFTDRYLYSRLATDTPRAEPQEFRAVMNAFLPRKRAVGQMLIRDAADRVLMCGLTYKPDWDIPGGVVEVGESPREGVVRELEEELGVTFAAGELVLVDWLPAWSGWDDAVVLIFDGGVHDVSLLDRLTPHDGEIAGYAFLTPAEVRERAADFTARRVEAALAAVSGTGPLFTESGR